MDEDFSDFEPIDLMNIDTEYVEEKEDIVEESLAVLKMKINRCDIELEKSQSIYNLVCNRINLEKECTKNFSYIFIGLLIFSFLLIKIIGNGFWVDEFFSRLINDATIIIEAILFTMILKSYLCYKYIKNPYDKSRFVSTRYIQIKSKELIKFYEDEIKYLNEK